MTKPASQPAVGIDLGTTFSAIAFLDPTGRPETIRNSEGDLTTPSAVFFDHKRPIVGIEAAEAGLLEPDRLALFAKRDVGESFYEKEIRGKHLPAEVIEALILRKLKADAELMLGPIEKAVITVPAFFNEPCRKATQDAGRLAGLDVLDIINEPTAAAITYGVQQGFLSLDGGSREAETVLVYDLGGGTFDVTVMKIENGNFNTIATAGDVYLGGVDWDKRVVDFIAEAFEKEHGVDPRDDPQAEQELLRKANQTKHALTQRESVTVAFAHDGRRLRTEITQQEFSDRCADLVERTLMTVQLVLDDADVDWSKLTRLILVGGSTRMPMIRQELERLSGMELDRSLSPDEAVSHGAALYAGMLMAGQNDKSGISVSNVNSHDLGILAVDPKTGQPRRQIMIPRNSHLPARKMVRFRTHSDNQANVKIEIVEGGDDRGTNATRIGRCIVEDLPRGTPKGTHVDVRFDYARDGRLTVHASLPEIDRKITMTLNRAAGLSDSEIQIWSERLDQGLSDAMLASLPADGSVVAEIELNSENADTDLDVVKEQTDAELPATSDTSSQTATDINAILGTLGTTPQPVASAAEPTQIESASDSEEVDFSELKAIDVLEPIANDRKASISQTAPANLFAPTEPLTSKTDVVKAASSVPASSVPAVNPAEKAPQVKIDLGDQVSESPAKINADELQSFAKASVDPKPVIKEKPKIDLGSSDSVAKADSGDLAMLAALSGGQSTPKAASVDTPFIVTDKSPKTDGKPAEKPKKSGFFGRKKR